MCLCFPIEFWAGFLARRFVLEKGLEVVTLLHNIQIEEEIGIK